MDISEQSFEHLTSLVYETLEKNETWDVFYDAISRAVDVQIVHMLGIDKTHGALSYSGGVNMPPQGELNYIQNYHFLDPRSPIVIASKPMTWTHCHEVLDEAFVANDPFYQEFLIPEGLRYMSACKVVDDENAIVIFSTLRSPEKGPLRADAIAFLNRLMPHLARVCRLSVKNFIYSTQALVGHALVNKLRQPVLLTTVKGDVVHVNYATKNLLDSTKEIAIQNGKLVLPVDYAAMFLRECEALEAALKVEGASSETNASQFKTLRIKISGQHASQDEYLYAFITMLVPQAMLGTFGLRPLVMVFFYHPDSAPVIDASLLIAAFGLSPAECRIATMLADGYALKEIAGALSVQHDTIRKHLQSIYQKTATNRQPELIRLLLNLPTNAIQSLV